MIEGLNDLYCFHVGKGKGLTFHLFFEKLDIFWLAVSNASIETAEDGTHAVLSSVTVDVGL